MSDTISIKNLSKEQVREFLPDAIQKAFDSYCEFMGQKIDTSKAKLFSDHHNACKVAIAHVNLLLKLADWADMDVRQMNIDPAILSRAQADYAAYVPDEEDDDDS